MTKLKLYFDLLSQPCRTLYVFMKKTEIPFEPRLLNLRQGEHLTEEFANLNPFKKVPLIDDDGFILTESIAILRYLCRSYNVADHLYPKDSKKQARVDEYLEWQHLNTRSHCMNYFREKALLPMLTGKLADPKRILLLENRMNENLDLLENVWLKNKPFLCGDEISISDLIAACEIEQPRMAGFNPLVDRPNLTKWYAKVQSEFSPFYEEANKVIKETVEEYKRFSELNKIN